jgi:acyl carrier protein
MSDEVMDTIKGMVAERLGVSLAAEEIDEMAPILDEGVGLDSIRLLELIVDIEKRFAIELSDDKLTMDTFQNLQSLARVIRERLATSYAGSRQHLEHPAPGELAPAIEQQRLATASEVNEQRTDYLVDALPDSTAPGDRGASDLAAITAASIERIDTCLSALQRGLSRIESKFATLAS